jgi:hypothetical protein
MAGGRRDMLITGDGAPENVKKYEERKGECFKRSEPENSST